MKIKSSTMDKVFVTCNTIFLVLFVTITLYPVLNTVALSFNDGVDAVRGGIHLWPRIFTLSNYKTVLHQQNILTGAVVSVARTVLGTIFSLVTNALLAYIISRKRFLFRSQLSLFWVITMYVNGGMIPTFLIVKDYRLLNTVWAMILPSAVSTYNMILMRTFFLAIPSSLVEAAELDGCTDFGILFKIVLPLSMASLMTIGMFYAVGHWNSYFNAVIYLSDKELFPLQIILRQVVLMNEIVENASSTESNMAEGIKYATIVVAMLPMLCVYPFVQKYFVKGVMIGSVKE